MKTPISLIIDDSAPRVFVYREHAKCLFTADGRPLVPDVPNAFLERFCDTVETYGIRGKFSVVPCPGGRGDIVGGLEGFPDSELSEWLRTVKTRLSAYFAFCPEMLTHARTVDLEHGGFLEENEAVWSQRQTRKTLTPYITRALALCRDAGIDCTGVTSPWNFGEHVEEEYAAAISEAMYAVSGRSDAWYFCRSLYRQPNARPWVSLRGDTRRVVAIPGTVDDAFWQTMDTTDTTDAYVSRIADYYLKADGTSGAIVDVLNTNGYPILTTHWQSMFSNGLWTGVRALGEVARRVRETLSERVEWTGFDELMRMTLDAPVHPVR
ncbi:MAG: hypothetical protein VB111_03850 [Clostridiaceae bacterium]|nr:hypothetical protein [Clostridiaceae bacterium]